MRDVVGYVAGYGVGVCLAWPLISRLAAAVKTPKMASPTWDIALILPPFIGLLERVGYITALLFNEAQFIGV